jgi:hypothetical protein
LENGKTGTLTSAIIPAIMPPVVVADKTKAEIEITSS